MVYDRVDLSRKLLTDSGVVSVAIDDFEGAKLQLSLDEILGFENRLGSVTLFIIQAEDMMINLLQPHMNITFFMPSILTKRKQNYLPLEESDISTFKHSDELGNYRVREFRRSGNNSSREARPKMFYPILIKDNQIHFITDDEYSKIHDSKSGNLTIIS